MEFQIYQRATIDAEPTLSTNIFYKPIIIVKNQNELAAAVMTNARFTLDASFTSVTIPISANVSMVPAMEALANNTTVTELIIGLGNWQPKDVSSFIECLSQNKSITRIMLLTPDFRPACIEALSKMLKANTHLKTIEVSSQAYSFSEEGWDLFSAGMAEYHFEELFFNNSTISSERFQRLFGQLRHARSLKKLKVVGTSLSDPAWNSLCDSLVANPSITDLYLHNCINSASAYTKFKEVVKANSLQKVSLMGTDLSSGNMALIKDELKNNTSITDLTVSYSRVDCQMLEEIFQENTTIQKLNITGCHIGVDDLKLLKLGSNTALKELTILSCYNLGDYGIVFSELLGNNTLKRLIVGTGQMDPPTLQQFIEQNKSVIELKIQTDDYTLSDSVLRAVADGLKINRTITKLSLPLTKVDFETFIYFRNVIMLENFKIIELHLPKLSLIFFDKVPGHAHSTTVEHLVSHLVTENKNLRFITGSEDYPAIDQQLKANREAQDKTIHDTVTFIKMIVMKPHSFVLPIELWVKIFGYVSYVFSDMDFEQFFRKCLK